MVAEASRHRQYTVEVERVERQTVTFVFEMGTGKATDEALTRIAIAHCDPFSWSEPEYRRTSLTSEQVRVMRLEDPQ